jgi:hypothetical protein
MVLLGTYLTVIAQRNSKTSLTEQQLFVKDSASQQKTSTKATPPKKDSLVLKHSPRKAAIRSAILPGWGQAYNREYWKLPIVYGALAIPTITFLYNNTWYRKTKDAFNIRASNDTGRFSEIDPKLQGLSVNSLQFYRNTFRQDRDYSVLWFVIVWALNVVDATVFAHLKEFDVSDDLSLRIQPQINQFRTPSLGFVLTPKNKAIQPRIQLPAR